MAQLRPSLSLWGEASEERPPRVCENKPVPLPWEEAGRQDLAVFVLNLSNFQQMHFSVQGLVGLVRLLVLMVRVSEVAGGLTAARPEFSLVTEKGRLSAISGADDYSRIKIFLGLRDLVLVLGPNSVTMVGIGSWQEARKRISGAGDRQLF